MANGNPNDPDAAPDEPRSPLPDVEENEEAATPGNKVSPGTNTTPVLLKGGLQSKGAADRLESGMRYGYEGGFIGNQIPFNEAVGYASLLRGNAESPLATPEDIKLYEDFLTDLRRYTGSKLGTDGGVMAAWTDLLKTAQRSGVPALMLLARGSMNTGEDGGGSGGRSRYGTTAQVAYANEADVRVLANSLAENLIGRTVTDKEFKKIYSDFRKEEGKNPTVTTTSPGGSVTQQGVTNAERQEILEEILMETPDFAAYQGGAGMIDTMRDINRESLSAAREAGAL